MCNKFEESHVQKILELIQGGSNLKQVEQIMGYPYDHRKFRRFIHKNYNEYYQIAKLNANRYNSEFKKKNNCMKNELTRQKVSNSVKSMWDSGHYDKRINGMLGKTQFEHPNFKFGKRSYMDICSTIHDISTCFICGDEQSKIDIHHIDENWDNWCKTNLMPLCVRCHQKFHFKHLKMDYEQYEYSTHIYVDNSIYELKLYIVLRSNMYHILCQDINDIISNSIYLKEFKHHDNLMYQIFEYLINQQIKGLTHITLDNRMLTLKQYIDYLIENKTIY